MNTHTPTPWNADSGSVGSECGEFVSMTLKLCSSAGADAQVGQQSHLRTAKADRAEVATGLHDPYQRTPQQEQELDVMRSRGEL